MKKIYFFTTVLLVLFAMNVVAQDVFTQVPDKDPVIHIPFNELHSSGKIICGGTEAFGGFTNYKDEVNESDTTMGHAWGGGSFEVMTFEDQLISPDGGDIQGKMMPAMHWRSYKGIEQRPQGITLYTNNGHGSYNGPIGTSGRTISMFFMPTDSLRIDTANGAWGGAPTFYKMGSSGEVGGKVEWYLDVDQMQIVVDWQGAKDYTETDILESNKWYHIALTIPDGGAREDVKLYVNAEEVEFDEDLAEGPEVTTIDTKRKIATAWDGVFIQRWACAWMADWRLYDSELNSDEIRQMVGLNRVSSQSLEVGDLFDIYPVPNNGTFDVNIAKTGVNNMIIRNMLGQLVHQQTVENKSKVNASHLKSGMYLVSVIDNENNYQTRKMMIR